MAVKLRLQVVKQEKIMADESSVPESSVEQEIMAAQGLEEISEDLLKGVDEESTDEESTDEKSTDEKSTDEKSTDEKSTDEKSTDEKSTDEESTDEEPTDEESTDEESTDEESTDEESTVQKKTPKGFVPLQALHETRSALKDAKADIEDLRQMVKDLKSKSTEPEAPKEPSFKVLTDEEFDELASEDPLEAVKYQRRERKYLQEQADRERADQEHADIEKDNARFIEEITTTELANMAKLVPGLFDETSEVRDNLMAQASEAGFTSDMFYLTDPGTKVILRGETEPKLLGSQATSIMKMLTGIKSKAEPDTKAIEASLRKSITLELLAKFKTDGAKAFKSIGDVPKTSTKKQKSKPTNLTESDYAKLSEAEQAKYLSGE